MASTSKPSVEEIHDLMSKEMMVQAVELGKKLNEDHTVVMAELEAKYGRACGYRYGIFYYYHFKIGSEIMIG